VLLMAGASGINVLFFRLLSQTRSRQTYRQIAVAAGGCSFFLLRALCVALVLIMSVQETLQLCSLFFLFFFWVPVEFLGAAFYHVSLINLSLSELFSFCCLFFPNAIICCNLFFLSCVLAYAI
jgi:hypothetical protein